MSTFKNADKAAKAGIKKHTDTVAGLILLALAGWGLSSCMAPDTPEEIRAKHVSRYLDKCESAGMWSVAAQSSPAQKYRDYLALAKQARDDMKAADPYLDEADCRAATAKGIQEGKKHSQRGAFD